MRILHVADRLPGRGGAYTWMLGILDGLAPHHEQTLVVGETAADADALRLPARVMVREGLESRTPAPVGWQQSAVVGLDDDDIGFADIDEYQPRRVANA